MKILCGDRRNFQKGSCQCSSFSSMKGIQKPAWDSGEKKKKTNLKDPDTVRNEIL